MRGAYLLKKCRQGYGFLRVCVSFVQSFTLFTADSNFQFVGKVKSTQCYFRFNAINRTKQ